MVLCLRHLLSFAFLRLHLQLSLNQTQQNKLWRQDAKLWLCVIYMCPAPSPGECDAALDSGKSSTCTVNQKRRNLYILMLPWDWYGGLKRKTLGQMWPHQQQQPPPPLALLPNQKNTPKTDPHTHTHRYAQSDSRLSPEWKARRIAKGKGYVCARRDRAEEGQERVSSRNRDRARSRNRSLFWAQNEIEQKFEANKGSTGGTRNEFILFAYVACFSIVLRGVNVAHCGQPF